jgi:hypothetical protein
MLYGRGKQWGIRIRDFILPARQEWGWMERERGRERRGICHAMTSGEGSKPLLRPPAQENQLSCIEQDRGGAMGVRDKRTHRRGQDGTAGRTAGRPAGRAYGPPPPHGSTPQPSAWRGGQRGKIPPLQNFLEKVNEITHYHSLAPSLMRSLCHKM